MQHVQAVEALLDDQVQLAVIFTASPSMASPDLVALEDPERFMLASHVVPLASDKLDDTTAALIDKVSAAMSGADLVALNTESLETEAPAATIASAWLASHADDLR